MSPSRPRLPGTVARTWPSSLHALDGRLRRTSSLSCSRSRSPGCPADRVGRAHVPLPGYPSASRSRSRCSPPSFLRVERLRVSVSRIHEARSIIGLPIMKRAPHMVPEAMKSSRSTPESAVRRAAPGERVLDTPSSNDLTISRLPARSRDCHCASRPCGEADPVTLVAQSFETDRAPRSPAP